MLEKQMFKACCLKTEPGTRWKLLMRFRRQRYVNARILREPWAWSSARNITCRRWQTIAVKQCHARAGNSQRAHKQTSKTLQKCIQKIFKMVYKCFKNALKMPQAFFKHASMLLAQNVSKSLRKCFTHAPKVFQNASGILQTCSKMMQAFSKMLRKFQKIFDNASPILQKGCKNVSRM